MHDFVIRNATIHDGLGAPPVVGDLAVSDGRIAAIGTGIGAARESIDAAGLVLMPGIIDSHTHYDAQITWDPMASPSPAMGVTTAVMGNCGFTLAPCKPKDRDLTMRHLTHVEGMSLDSLRAGVDWQFETFPEYLDALERSGVGPNVAAFIGHSTVRTWVMGADASKRPATPAEIEAMRRIVAEGLAAGAVGLSSTTSYQHSGEGGIPMPSRLATDEEFHSLVSVLGETDRGVFMMTKSSDTTPAWLQALAASARRPFLAAAILFNPGVPQAAWNDIVGVAEGRARGLPMSGAVSCCPLKFEFTMHEPYVFEGLNAWKPATVSRGLGSLDVYASEVFRQAVKDELAIPKRRIFSGDWHKVHVAMVKSPARRALEGRSVGAIAAADGKHPLDVLLDLALAEDLDTVFTAVLLNGDEDEVAKLLMHPASLVSLSDAGAHMTFFCDAGFGLHLLGHWVRELGVLGLEEAVWQLSGRPAEIFGIAGRGRLAPGHAADLLLLDPARVGRGPKRRVHDLPGGAPRLTTDPLGVHGVWVNGTRVVGGDGALLPARPGRLLRRFA